MKPNRLDIEKQFVYLDGGLYRRSTGKRGYTRPDGYVYTRLNGRAYGEHRLIHYQHTGEWPWQVDHINGVKSDNRPENLRSATHAQNCMNRKATRLTPKGCYWVPSRNKWIAQIGANGERKTLGYFETLEGAAKAYAEASSELHGAYSRAE